ncbi:MAG: bifunctional methionine sulfoxide reductase B/A protein [Planctomycetes bacterium]|nr:bifunctional methionine sulfoxide reductase B/A protein [Planctomycetota bacterium]
MSQKPSVHADKENAMDKGEIRELTAEEKAVIIDKGTERPFSGKYWDYFKPGLYTCRQCGAELFSSENKFESDCGWPSFDKALSGAVKRVPDADGRRTEILCSKCGGHLGHVFEGEQFTPLNTRHCVNSISLNFTPAADLTKKPATRAIFAGGCFWGVEYHFENLPGVKSVTSGYTGGTVEDPSYEQVCSGKTGHAEAVEIVFDPKIVSYRELAKLFFEIHDPVQVDRQGPDIGSQYRSELFYLDEEQKQIALSLIAELKEKGYAVATKVTKASEFYPAEQYHQDYYARTRKEPYCHIKVNRFD